MKFVPGTDRNLARVIEEIRREHDERLALLERKAGRAGIVTRDATANPGEFLNIEAPAAGLTITLPQAVQSRRNARVTLSFRNENPVRIVCVFGTVNGLAFVTNDQPGTYDAICDGLGGWAVQVGVTSSGSGAGGNPDAEYVVGAADATLPNARVATDSAEIDAVLTTPNVVSWVLNAASVAFSKLANLTGLSVLGRAANSSGVMAAITATRPHQSLMVNDAGTLLEWGYPHDWFYVTEYGATGDGVTDDTAAIQDAIDACEAAGGGTVYFPEGVYVVNGALQDTGRSNAQLLLPRVAVDAVTEPLSIRLLGPFRPVSQPSVVGAGAVLPDRGAIIQGTLATGGGSLMGAWGPSGSSEDFSFVRVEIQNLTLRMPANPTKSCLDLSHVTACDLDGLQIDAGNYHVPSIAAQTTATSYGLRLPKNNNGASTELGRVDVIGFYNGVECGEHCAAAHLNIWAATIGITFPFGNHSSVFQRLGVYHFKTGLFWSGVHSVEIGELNFEHAASGTWTVTTDISDASNQARGFVYWHTVLAFTGPVDTLVVSGAARLRRRHLSREAQVFSLTDAATVTIDCSMADDFRWTIGGNRTLANPSSPYDGQIIYLRVIQDATGGRTWTLGSKFTFPGVVPVLSTVAGAVDFVTCQYDLTDDTWVCVLEKDGSPVVTWNPSDKSADITLSNSNLTATKTTGNASRSVRATVGKLETSNGYFEVLVAGTDTTSNFRLVGISTTATPVANACGQDATSWGYYEQTGQKYTNNVLTAYGNTYTIGDVIGVAFKNGSVWFSKNGVYQNSGDPVAGTGAAFTGITGTVFPTTSPYRTLSPPHIMVGRFRTADFTYAPPAGFQPWEVTDLSAYASTSIVYANDTFQRAALTGFAASPQNSNATTSAEPIVTYSASANMSAERVTTSSTSVTVSTSVASQIEFQRAALTGAIEATANSNATRFFGIRENGSLATPRSNLNLLSTASMVVAIVGDTPNDEMEISWQRAALTGEVTAAQNSNATTITRSTAFTWTGSHTFAGTGTAFDVNVDNASGIDVASTFALASSGSSTFTFGADSSISVTGSLDVLSTTDITLDADDAVFVLGSGILQVGDGVVEGYIRMQASTVSAPTVSTNEGMFWVLDPGSTDTEPAFTDDANVDHLIAVQDFLDLGSVSGTLTPDITALRNGGTLHLDPSAATTIEAFTPAKGDGFFFFVTASGSNTLAYDNEAAAPTASERLRVSQFADSAGVRNNMAIVTRANGRWHTMVRA